MLKKTSVKPLVLAGLSGVACVLAFAPIEIVPVVLLCPWLLSLAVHHCRSLKQAFLAGFIASLAIMLGGFYWVIYVIHVFGYLPWTAATLIYLGFCGFGALNFPLFTGTQFWLEHRYPKLRTDGLWFVLGAPALFVVFEFAVPKLFPWYVGHTLYKSYWINQIVEFTGSEYLSLVVFSVGGFASAWQLNRLRGKRLWFGLIPLLLTCLAVGFSLWRENTPLPKGHTKRVALIQANIGSLEKVQAEQGLFNKVRYVVDRHLELTRRALREEKKPALILWPETAMPFSLLSQALNAEQVKQSVLDWNIPLITGGYAPVPGEPFRDYNTAYLLEPSNREVRLSMYYKNILLAFGEYFPGGEFFPKLYTFFPQVSNFKRGHDQRLLTLSDGTRLGMTICYEAIVPSFFRKVASQGVHAIINLTNDSWFGPTSEPYQHAALTVFRAIESRTPLIRVTNTGLSFTVDRRGRMSDTTPVYEEGVLSTEVTLPSVPVITFYLRYGDWLILLLIVCILGLLLRAKRAPVHP